MSCEDIIIEVETEPIVIEMTPEGKDGKAGNGIASITLLSTVGRVKTYRITFTDGTHFDYEVEDGAPGPAGNGIASISLLGTSGLEKTYRINFTNGGHYDYVVTDGAQGAPGTDGVGIVSVYKTGTSGLVDTYTILYSNGNTDEFTVTNGAQGPQGPTGPTGNGISSVEKIGTVGLVDTYRINFTNGTHYDYTVTNGQDGDDPEWGNITGNLADQTDLKAALDEKADIIHTSTSGSLVHLTDAAAYPVDALTVGIEPVQDLHGYSNPWPAGGGKNLWELASSGSGNSSYIFNRQTLNKPIPAGTYTLSFDATIEIATQIIYKDSENNTVGSLTIRVGDLVNGHYSGTITLSNTGTQVEFYSNGASSLSKIQLESGSVATSYAPYSNICPISGHSSAVVTRTGNELGPIETGGFDSNGLNTAGNRARSVNYIPVTVGDVYYCYGKSNTGTLQFSASFYDKNDYTTARISFTSWANSGSNFTVPSGAKYMRILMRNAEEGVFTASTVNYAIVSSHIQTVTIALGSTYYGAQLNVLTGELTVDRQIVTLSDISDLGTSGTGTGKFATYNAGVSCDPSKPLVCERMKSIVFANRGQAYQCYINPNSITSLQTFVPSDATVESVNSALSGSKVVVPLASPLTVTLDPATLSLLLGENNVWADTGDVSVGYRADTKRYIDGAISERDLAIKSLMTNVEAQMKATKNYTSGQVVIVGDGFYKLTANVSSGSALTVGTNCVKTDMATWILSIV